MKINFKDKFKKKGFKTSLVLCALFAAFAVSNQKAEAATDGTGGVVSGGGYVYWAENRDSANFSGYSPAWNTWSNHQRRLYASVDSRVASAGGSNKFLNECRESEYIWWLRAANNGFWAIYTDGATQSVPWLPWQSDPRRGDSRWKDYMNSQGNSWNSGRVNIICSANFKPKEENRSKVETRTTSEKTTLNGIYSTSTVVSPRSTEEFLKYTPAQKAEWWTMHEIQNTPEVKTAYGEWYDKNISKIKSLNGKTGNDFKNLKAELENGAKAAIAKGQLPPDITLSTKNRKGFAKGGVIDVIERTRNQSVEISNSKDQRRTQTWRVKIINGKDVEIPGTRKDSGWVDTGVKGKAPNVVLSSPVGRSFWQMIHAKCNDLGMKNVSRDLGSQGINATASDSSVSDTMRTKPYSSQLDLQLGNVAGKTPTFKSTAYDGFYNQTSGCLPVIDCISDPTDPKNGSDSANNVQDSADKRNYTYGAQSNAVVGSDTKLLSSDAFTFFRDNDTHNIRVDLWYPKVNTANTGITVDPKPTLFTRLFFDKNGTPAKDLVSVTANKKQILTGEDISNGKGYMTNGELTNIGMASQWASDEGKPHRFNVDWVSEPTVTNTVYTNVNGNGGASGATTDTSKIRVYCPMTLNSKTPSKPSIDLNPSSSRPVTGITEFNTAANKSVAVDFVRAGSGLNQREGK